MSELTLLEVEYNNEVLSYKTLGLKPPKSLRRRFLQDKKELEQRRQWAIEGRRDENARLAEEKASKESHEKEERTFLVAALAFILTLF